LRVKTDEIAQLARKPDALEQPSLSLRLLQGAGWSENFEQEMLHWLHWLDPQKASYVGDGSLTMLIDRARSSARDFAFSTVREQAIMVALLFAFGHSCIRDPLYPWISKTLRDSPVDGPEARAIQLEEQAQIWFKRVSVASGPASSL
jgi:hypothetical protein